MSPSKTLILAALLLGTSASPGLTTAAAAANVAHQETGVAVASAPGQVAARNRNCGNTLRTVYHSCVFARHVAGYYRKSTGHGYMEAQLVSAHSGNFYWVECNGWDRIVCYTDAGKITFRVSKIPRW